MEQVYCHGFHLSYQDRAVEAREALRLVPASDHLVGEQGEPAFELHPNTHPRPFLWAKTAEEITHPIL